MANPNPPEPVGDYAAIRPHRDHRTVVSFVTCELRDLITGGDLSPGLRLPYRDVAARLGVSATPVRMALHALATEGLVDLIPYGGARVSRLSIEELEEVYASRAGVEGLLAHRGAENMSEDAIEEMRSKLMDLEQLGALRARDGYLEASWAFKSICYEHAKREALFDAVKLLVARSERYSVLALDEHYRFDEALRYQRRLFEACERRSGWDAEIVTREAADWSRSYLLTRLIDQVTEE